jgi:DNA ligase (NAD+)
MGEALIGQLVDAGMIANMADLYDLTREKLMPLERMGNTLASKLVHNIHKSKTQSFTRLIYALGIPHIGEHLAEVLTANFSSIEALKAVSQEELQTIPEIGPEIAKSLKAYFSEVHNLELLAKLKALGLNMQGQTLVLAGKTLAGKSFVFTGAMESLSREEAEAKVKALGGKASSSVSKNTGYVVVGTEPGSKYQKALELGVKIISEEEFLKLIDQRLKTRD